jgi:hypothetical protein
MTHLRSGSVVQDLIAREFCLFLVTSPIRMRGGEHSPEIHRHYQNLGHSSTFQSIEQVRSELKFQGAQGTLFWNSAPKGQSRSLQAPSPAGLELSVLGLR